MRSEERRTTGNTPAVVRNLPRLIELLEEERAMPVELPANLLAQWDTFRTLVNTRPPVPASAEFLTLQDELLRALIAWRGITQADTLSPVPSDPRLVLWQGDITLLAADAVVNAANSQMLGCFVPGHFCIDNAIHTFAGVQLRLECARLMELQGHAEPTGRAKVTPAYNLPSRHIVHTVGPIASGAPSETDRALLASCYRSCLEAADALGCATLAFCCISTGVFGFPQKEAAAIALATVRAWLDAHPLTSVARVIFNVFTPEDLRIYQSLLPR